MTVCAHIALAAVLELSNEPLEWIEAIHHKEG